MRKQVLSLLVDNAPGVTSRISGLFSRRGYNIDSFSSGETSDPRYTRITIVATGDELILEQIQKQLAKLEDVRDIKVLEDGSSVTRELILVKIRALDTQRQAIVNVADIFHGKVVSVTTDSMIVELTGTQSKLDAFMDLLGGYEILELARTGLTGLTRGSSDVVYLD
ncbi:MAG: acetolactate synthase small subunit [Agathobacter sp.]|nr:acetolactate synthase small subunit [Agathobacter sp.]